MSIVLNAPHSTISNRFKLYSEQKTHFFLSFQEFLFATSGSRLELNKIYFSHLWMTFRKPPLTGRMI